MTPLWDRSAFRFLIVMRLPVVGILYNIENYFFRFEFRATKRIFSLIFSFILLITCVLIDSASSTSQFNGTTVAN